MNIGFEAAAEGRPEMAFWPVTAFAILYIDVVWWVSIPALIVLGLAGAMSYQILRQMRRAITNARNVNRRRNRVSRRRSVREHLTTMTEQITDMLPNSNKTFIIFVGGVMLDFFAGLVLLFILGYQILVQSASDVVTIGLFILPILYLFTVVSVFLWHW